eukprot:scaffold30051_cov57-Phaeocystis_antarctica.AAC.2
MHGTLRHRRRGPLGRGAEERGLLCDSAATTAEQHGVDALEQRVDDRLARRAHRALLRVAHCVHRVADLRR